MHGDVDDVGDDDDGNRHCLLGIVCASAEYINKEDTTRKMQIGHDAHLKAPHMHDACEDCRTNKLLQTVTGTNRAQGMQIPVSIVAPAPALLVLAQM